MASEPLPPTMDAAPGAKFYFQGQKLLLTYADIHLDKEPFTEFIEACAGYAPKFVRLAHETGLSTGKPFLHTHVLIDFGKRFQTRDCRRFDWDSGQGILHPNWRQVKSATHWHNCTQYLAKEDPENKDLLVKSCASQVWEARTLQDALLKNCISPGDAPGVIALYGARPRAPPRIPRPDRPWHEAAFQLLEGPPSFREIHWFYDPVGGAGKSWLADYLGANELAYVVDQCGGGYHFATVVQNAIASGWNGRTFVFDFPKTMHDHAFYGCLESVKNGRVTALKYQGGTIHFARPHVLVLCNFYPKLDALAAGRFRVHRILEDGTLEKPLFPTEEASLGGDSVATPTESEALTLKNNRPPHSPPKEDNVASAPLSVADLEEVLGDLTK